MVENAKNSVKSEEKPAFKKEEVLEKKAPSLLNFLKAGVHFGHHTSRWHPKMAKYIFAKRQGIHVIDLEKTQEGLDKAMDFLGKVAKEGKIILFVGTKSQIKDIVKKYAEKCEMPYIVSRWLGGTFTNLTTIKKQIDKLKAIEKEKKEGGFDKYTKKERSEKNKEIEKLNVFYGGIKDLPGLPDAVLIVDVKHEDIAVAEAQKKRVPIVALVDTNSNPEGIDYIVPANDDAVSSVDLVLGFLVDAINTGK